MSLVASGYIDGHCHLADPRLSSELERLIEESAKHGIAGFVQGGVDPEDWERQLALKDRFPGKIVTAFGLHPWWVAGQTAATLSEGFKRLESRAGEAEALGEMGLDHSPKIPEMTRPLQEEAFGLQLELAAKLRKPLVLHIVRAHERAIEILRASSVKQPRGLVHSFSASREIAKKYLDLGLSLSISGVICRKGFETLKRAVSYIPLDRLVVETDSPDQSPDQREGLNQPANLIGIAEAIGALRQQSAREVLEQSAANIREIFS